MSFHFTWFFIAASVLAVLSTLFWYFKRQPNKIVSVPILRILKKHKASQLRLQNVRPPMLLLAPFFLMCGLLVFTAAQPYEVHEEKFSRPADSIYLLADFSPSMSVNFDAMVYREKIAAFRQQLRGAGYRVILDSTHPRAGSFAEVEFDKLDFHIEAADLGHIISSRLADLPQGAIILIISDGESSSWKNFRWQSLNTTHPVRLVDYSLEKKVSNVFIDDMHFSIADKKESIFLRIQRNDSRAVQDTKATIFRGFENKEVPLAQHHFTFEVGQKNLEHKLQWLTNEDGGRGTTYTIKLDVEGDEGLVLDNKYLFEPSQVDSSLLIYANMSPESYLLDGSYYLKSFLDSRDAKYKFTTELTKKSFENSTNMVIHLGPTYNRKDCQPVVGTKIEKIWLAPYDHTGNIQNLCSCLNDFTSLALRCVNIEERRDLQAMLRDKSAKRIGGELGGDGDSAVGYRVASGDLDIAVFMSPLMPAFSTPLHYGNYASIVDKLFRWFFPQIVGSGRAEGITALNGATGTFQKRVAYRESLLDFLDESQLPPKFEGASGVASLSDFTNQTVSSENIIKVLLWVVILFSVIESTMAYLYLRRVKRVRV